MCGSSNCRFFLLREQELLSIEDMFSRLFQDDQSDSRKRWRWQHFLMLKPTWQERHVGSHCQCSIDNKKSNQLLLGQRVFSMESSSKKISFNELKYIPTFLAIFISIDARNMEWLQKCWLAGMDTKMLSI